MNDTPRRPQSWLSLAVIVGVVWGAHQAWSQWREHRDIDAVRATAGAQDIVMFTTNDCPYCAKARAWFKANEVPWRECNIERNAMCKQVFDARGAPGVPLLHVRGQWQLGFNPAQLAEALATVPRKH